MELPGSSQCVLAKTKKVFHCIHAEHHLSICNNEQVSWSIGMQRTIKIKILMKALPMASSSCLTATCSGFSEKVLISAWKKFDRIHQLFLQEYALTTFSSTMETLVSQKLIYIFQSNLVFVFFCFGHLMTWKSFVTICQTFHFRGIYHLHCKFLLLAKLSSAKISFSYS